MKLLLKINIVMVIVFLVGLGAAYTVADRLLQQNAQAEIQDAARIMMESALAVERENQQLLFQSEDAKEGLAAYVEKRPAVFKAK